METLIDYDFTPKINYYFKYEIDIEKSKEKLTQVVFIYQYIDENNNLKVEENKELVISKEQKVGYYFKDFLNWYQYEFNEILNMYKDLLMDSTKVDKLDNGEILSINLLRNFLYMLKDYNNEYGAIIGGEIINCLWLLEYHIPKYKQLLYIEMENWKKAQNFDDVCQNRVNELKEQIDKLEGKDYYDEQCLKCMDYIIKKVKDVVNFWDNIFKTNGEENKTKIFKGTNLNVPKCEVEYTKVKTHPKAIKYTFKVYNLMELSHTSMYMFDKVKPLRVIAKCKNCGDYFIPDKNNIEYCNKYLGKDENGEKITCRRKGSSRQFGNKDIDLNEIIPNTTNYHYVYYHRIYNRLNGNEKIEFSNGYDDLKKKFKDNGEQLKIEQLKYISKYDKKSQKPKKGKRGRPYKKE